MASNDRVNIASGNDRVAVQAGHVGGGSGESEDTRPEMDQPADGGGTVTNIVTGNARVGVQADVINGDLTIIGW